MNSILGFMFILIPVLFVYIIYSQGGLFAIILYLCYILSIFASLGSLVLGVKLLTKGSNKK